MASAGENSNFSPSVLRYERSGARGAQGSFGSNVLDYASRTTSRLTETEHLMRPTDNRLREATIVGEKACAGR